MFMQILGRICINVFGHKSIEDTNPRADLCQNCVMLSTLSCTITSLLFKGIKTLTRLPILKRKFSANVKRAPPFKEVLSKFFFA